MHVVLCNVLPGSGYRLRATSKIGEISGHSSLLRGFGDALAQPCRARTRDRRRRWSGEGGHKRVELRASDLDVRHKICASLKKLYQELSPHCAQSQAH